MASATKARPAEMEQLRERLTHDFPFYAEECLRIVNKAGDLVPFTLKPAQLRLEAKLEAQRLAGRPQRALILKARQIGFSTYAQGKGIQRTTQRPFHNALTVAQDKRSAGELFEKGEIMHANLPDDPELGLKPTIRNKLHRQALYFGTSGRQSIEQGHMGLMSKYLTDTAKEVEAGRGFTYHTLHLSEVAFWDHVTKLTALLETVPDDADTLVLMESTANGFNHFRKRWIAAERGESDYIAHFESWLDEPTYQTPFMDADEKARFEESIGEGDYGEDEPDLQGLGATPEQLHWRRRRIGASFDGDLRMFKQEYPSTAHEAFLSSGQTRFSPILIDRAVRHAQAETDNACEWGHFEPGSRTTVRTAFGSIDIPRAPRWVPRKHRPSRLEGIWRVWEHPVPREVSQDPETGAQVARAASQHVCAVDPAGGETNLDIAQNARNAIEIIDHRTLAQVAEYVSYEDADLLAEQAFLAAVYFNNAWLAVEITGGWGLSMARRHAQGYKYPFVYRRRKVNTPQMGGDLHRLGWSTDSETKPYIEDLFAKRLREGTHGIRSAALASEMNTYIRDERGRSGPEDGEYSDRLLAYMIAHAIAQEKPVRPDRPPGGGLTSTSTRRIASGVTGY